MGVVARVGDHACAQRVQVNVAMTLQHVTVIADETGLVATLPKGAGSAVPVVDVAHVAPTERLHGAGDASWCGGGHQQVDVVGHQNVGVHRARFTAGDLAQILQVPHIVDLREKAGTTVVAALDDVLGDVRQIEAWMSWHGRRSFAVGQLHLDPEPGRGLSANACRMCQENSTLTPVLPVLRGLTVHIFGYRFPRGKRLSS